MNDGIFKEGGPYKVKRVGMDKYSMQMSIPADADGFVGRNCPDNTCCPGYFKVKLGTGITDNQLKAYCPYCRYEEEPNNFFTTAQIEYAKQIALREAVKGINEQFKGALGLGSSGKKTYGKGMFTLEMSYKPGNSPPVIPPMEEVLRRDVTCPNCGLQHTVFGLATWCPDCGHDIFLVHVVKEFEVVKKMLSDVKRRQDSFGARVAARDIENALEDVVSIFEAAMRAMTRRKMREVGLSDDQIQEKLKKIGNKYQNIELAQQVWKGEFNVQLLSNHDSNEIDSLRLTFEKRHPITHNLGIIDRKYLEKVRLGELEGRDVIVTPEEINVAIELATKILEQAHSQLFIHHGQSGDV
ncbi:MAG: hypothetical protein JXA46_06940 [Dehalococcoidales bacterium]|nr:hypothetical protein [Dehalococcoidales bacterium]